MDADASCLHLWAQDSLHAKFILPEGKSYAFPSESFTVNDSSYQSTPIYKYFPVLIQVAASSAWFFLIAMN